MRQWWGDKAPAWMFDLARAEQLDEYRYEPPDMVEVRSRVGWFLRIWKLAQQGEDVAEIGAKLDLDPHYVEETITKLERARTGRGRK